MELGRLWKLSIPEIKVYWRKTKTWRVENSKFVKKTLRQEISTDKIAHSNDKGRNTVIRDVIAADAIVTVLS